MHNPNYCIGYICKIFYKTILFLIKNDESLEDHLFMHLYFNDDLSPHEVVPENIHIMYHF